MSKIIAVDFDGTLCENEYPKIGKPRWNVIHRLKYRQIGCGAKIILWTCREGRELDEAVKWCSEHGIEFDAINENLMDRIEIFKNDCRKIGADEYWDDKAVKV